MGTAREMKDSLPPPAPQLMPRVFLNFLIVSEGHAVSAKFNSFFSSSLIPLLLSSFLRIRAL